jgi:hypothetical protein
MNTHHHHENQHSNADIDWMSHAACRTRADLAWLAEPEQVDAAQEAAMVMVCARCPVLVACETYTEATDVTGGFWAGHHRTPYGPLLPLAGDAA